MMPSCKVAAVLSQAAWGVSPKCLCSWCSAPLPSSAERTCRDVKSPVTLGGDTAGLGSSWWSGCAHLRSEDGQALLPVPPQEDCGWVPTALAASTCPPHLLLVSKLGSWVTWSRAVSQFPSRLFAFSSHTDYSSLRPQGLCLSSLRKALSDALSGWLPPTPPEGLTLRPRPQRSLSFPDLRLGPPPPHCSAPLTQL